MPATASNTMNLTARQQTGSQPPGIRSGELVVLAAVLVIGFALRLLAFSRAAVEHFDEGVYAPNVYFGPPDYAYPQQRFFGPPLLPALIEGGMIAGLPANVAALMPSFIAGCATIVALWWFGRYWFGPPAGIAAATLLAVSGFHIAFSVTALTDVLLGLWLVLALHAIGRSLLDGDVRWAIGGGIFTGLAWWTKYNGWLPLAIAAAVLPVLAITVRPTRQELFRWITCVGVTALVAVAVWTPNYLSLQSQGGYAPIAANHAKYFVGFSGWLDAARRQAAALPIFESPLDKASFFMAYAAALASVKARRWGPLAYAALVVPMSIFFTSAVALAIAGAIRLCVWTMSLNEPKRDSVMPRRITVGGSLLAVWFGGLFLVTPLYTPYPRLMLPWLLSMCMAAGWAVASLANASEAHEALRSSGWRRIALLGTVAVAGIVVALLKPGPAKWEIGTWQCISDRRGVETIAEQIHEGVGSLQPRLFYIYGEPAMFFQLRAAGEEFAAPIADVPTEQATLDGQPMQTCFIAGPHAEHDPHFQEQWVAASRAWQLVRTFEYQPSPIVRLDLEDPRKQTSAAPFTVRLYQFQR
jgi:dolichyl-phosphate-mannose-protein mannosyltransferase